MTIAGAGALPTLALAEACGGRFGVVQQQAFGQALRAQGAPVALAPDDFAGGAPCLPGFDPGAERIGLALGFALIGRAQWKVEGKTRATEPRAPSVAVAAGEDGAGGVRKQQLGSRRARAPAV